MTLNASGPISLGGSTTGQSINIELGQSATAQVSLNDTNVRSLAGVPSGAIIMPTNFYGKSNFTPVTRTYNTGSGTETIPTGASQVVITVWGNGGGGGYSGSNVCANNDGGGGGGGGYALKTIALSSSNWGQTFNYAIGSIGGRGTVGSQDGGAGGASTATNGTFSSTVSLSGGGGLGGQAGNAGGNQGTGGIASGGDINTNGEGGVASYYVGGGSPNGGSDQITYGASGNAPGGGGSGGLVAFNQVGGNGASGRVRFAYT